MANESTAGIPKAVIKCLVTKVLATRVWGPGFKPQNPYSSILHRDALLQSQLWGGRSLELTGHPPSQLALGCSERPCLQKAKMVAHAFSPNSWDGLEPNILRRQGSLTGTRCGQWINSCISKAVSSGSNSRSRKLLQFQKLMWRFCAIGVSSRHSFDCECSSETWLLGRCHPAHASVHQASQADGYYCKQYRDGLWIHLKPGL